MTTENPPRRPSVPKTLVAGYDGSQGAGAAVRWAAEHVAQDGRLVVVCAISPQVSLIDPDARRDHARAELEALWMADDRIVDAEIELIVAEDSPADALCRAASAVGADGIVVGTHHAGPFNADTVRQLVRIAERPVTVVPG